MGYLSRVSNRNARVRRRWVVSRTERWEKICGCGWVRVWLRCSSYWYRNKYTNCTGSHKQHPAVMSSASIVCDRRGLYHALPCVDGYSEHYQLLLFFFFFLTTVYCCTWYAAIARPTCTMALPCVQAAMRPCRYVPSSADPLVFLAARLWVAWPSPPASKI